MDYVFKSKAEFEEESANVYNFFNQCYDTIRKYIEENGAIEIPEDEEDEWRFSFLELGVCQVSSICIDCDDICLKARNGNGRIDIFWDDVNNDLTIVEMIMGKVLEEE